MTWKNGFVNIIASLFLSVTSTYWLHNTRVTRTFCSGTWSRTFQSHVNPVYVCTFISRQWRWSRLTHSIWIYHVYSSVHEMCLRAMCLCVCVCLRARACEMDGVFANSQHTSTTCGRPILKFSSNRFAQLKHLTEKTSKKWKTSFF